MTTLNTKNGQLLVKDGKLQTDCGCCGGWYCCDDKIAQCKNLADVLRVTTTINGGDYMQYSYAPGCMDARTGCWPAIFWRERTVLVAGSVMSGTHVGFTKYFDAPQGVQNVIPNAFGYSVDLRVKQYHSADYTSALSSADTELEVLYSIFPPAFFYEEQKISQFIPVFGNNHPDNPPVYPVNPTGPKGFSDMSAQFRSEAFPSGSTYASSYCYNGITKGLEFHGKYNTYLGKFSVLCGSNFPISVSDSGSWVNPQAARCPYTPYGTVIASESGSKDFSINILIERI